MCLISYVGYPCLYTMAPYVVYPAEAGGQGPFYDEVYTAGAYGQGGFLPTWMAVWFRDRVYRFLGWTWFIAWLCIELFQFRMLWIFWLCASSYAEAGLSFDMIVSSRYIYSMKCPLSKKVCQYAVTPPEFETIVSSALTKLVCGPPPATMTCIYIHR